MNKAIKQLCTPSLSRHSILAGLLGLSLLGGCTLGPRYERPSMSTAMTYPSSGSDQVSAGINSSSLSATSLMWQDFYQTKALQVVIQLALENNRDLRVAVLNIQAAQAQYRIQRADELPTLSGGFSGDVERYPQSVSPTGAAETWHAYNVNGAVASYELDLFGRVKSLSQEALQKYFSTIEARKAAQISLVSSVATAWLTYQADANLLEISQRTLKNQKNSLLITSAMLRDGTGTQLDVSQAETLMRTAEVSVARYRRLMKQDVNALTLLVGSSVPLASLSVLSMSDIRLNDSLSPGVPSDLLARRPDILGAEAALKAANADIGAARADFFPRITLTASGGTASAGLDSLFAAGSAAWSFAPEISVPIFNYGRIRANLKYSQVERDMYVSKYQKTIQTAFREVADALDGVATYREQEVAQAALVQASAQSYSLSMEQFRDGTGAFLPALVSQRALFTAQQDLITLQLARSTNTLSLYAALGGGWNRQSTAAVSAAPNGS